MLYRRFLFTIIAMLAGIFVYVSCLNSEIEPIEEQESSQELITAENLGIEDEEMLAVVAMALLDYQKTVIDQPISRTTAGGCVVEALGVREVVNAAGKGAAKKVAKVVAKAVLKKAIPYVGWGFFIYDYVACVVE